MQKFLGREPALVIAAINALIMIVGTMGFGVFNNEQAGVSVAVVNAAAGVLTALVTRPIGPAAFTSFIAAVLALLAAYQVNIPGETVAAINAAVYPLLAFLTRGNVSPVETAVTKPSLDPTPSAAKYEAAHFNPDAPVTEP